MSYIGNKSSHFCCSQLVFTEQKFEWPSVRNRNDPHSSPSSAGLSPRWGTAGQYVKAHFITSFRQLCHFSHSQTSPRGIPDCGPMELRGTSPGHSWVSLALTKRLVFVHVMPGLAWRAHCLTLLCLSGSGKEWFRCVCVCVCVFVCVDTLWEVLRPTICDWIRS